MTEVEPVVYTGAARRGVGLKREERRGDEFAVIRDGEA